MKTAWEAKQESDSYYSPAMVDDFLTKAEVQIEEAISEGNYEVTIGISAEPSIVIDKAIPLIQESGYKTSRKVKELKIMWGTAVEPE